jgi:hypothetical protein
MHSLLKNIETDLDAIDPSKEENVEKLTNSQYLEKISELLMDIHGLCRDVHFLEYLNETNTDKLYTKRQFESFIKQCVMYS